MKKSNCVASPTDSAATIPALSVCPSFDFLSSAIFFSITRISEDEVFEGLIYTSGPSVLSDNCCVLSVPVFLYTVFVIIQLKNWKKCLTRFFCIFSDFKEDCLPT
ncbi:MAG: hypothetical protein KZQ60_10910, partial [Candidatus Thiodiazotropha sp. (ex Lucinoma aequizonata)]|nr:hypothetical protein [Candidatus Thiodiazotropha sp. (ex Lucinoma aequizonata)]MCU7888293.1 hypothetical protein [Candidatus Thiodiazotropha sp. (ex Lucinoma aequizonata)]MCU7900017.1 hypothetical protein [Candidatus Thiodiazotropha sp. (ex Lucinoma aequizonata)]MCU7911169.1 hypothetical protein [Candidatus Thiodiazotropha sp. (ex Lucinoma aequizonata)]